MKRLFGTDGIRGVANKTLTPQLVYNIGKAVALIHKNKLERVKIVIGKDNRQSSDMFEASLCAGITAHGGETILVGVIPTAGVTYLCRELKANAGIIITASHNEASFNGIKIFNGNGYKLTSMQELQIEKLIYDNENLLVENADIGKIYKNPESTLIYEDYLVNSKRKILKGLKICVDCANGAGSEIAPKVLKRLGAKVTVINDSGNGLIINKNCGATSLNSLVKKVKAGKFDLGFALDGDADRLIVVDEKGNIINGDDILYMVAKHFMQKNQLNKNTVVGTVMTSYSTEMSLKELNIKLDRVKVGDKYVVNHMLKNNLNFGGEQSGHIIFKDFSTTADGILTAIKLAQIVKEKGVPISSLICDIKKYYQVLLNVKIEEEKRDKITENKLVKKMIASSKKQILNKGRVVVRASGTENVIRIMVEGKNRKLVDELARNIKKVVKSV